MTTGAFVVARLSSTRLPAKSMMEILNRPMIELFIERIRHSKTIDKVIIATSNLPSDDPLEDLAQRIGVHCYRGSLERIQERITGAAETFGCDTIVELLGDNPLIHSSLIDHVMGFYLQNQLDYVSTLTQEYGQIASTGPCFTLGVRVQAYSLASAQKYSAYPEYIGNDDKHPCAYIFEHPDEFSTGFVQARDRWAFMNRPALNFAVNYKKNFDFVRSVFEKQYPLDQDFPLEKVYQQLDECPWLYGLLGSE